MQLTISSSSTGRVQPGSAIAPEDAVAEVTSFSTEEYGALKKIVLWEGIIGSNVEKKVDEITFNDGRTYRHQSEKRVQGKNVNRYIRGESATMSADGAVHRCLTNPIWIVRDPELLPQE
jgi:hypothetical protein